MDSQEKGLDPKAVEFLKEVPDSILQQMSFTMPWQNRGNRTDEDGFSLPTEKKDSLRYREELQQVCWEKFNEDPFVNTTIRGQVGRQAGWGFETTSEVYDIHEIIEETETNYRNRLYNFYPKWFGRFQIEGELFLLLTLHLDGFVEIDFIDPSSLMSNGDEGTGIIFHPFKSTMPLFYNIKVGGQEIQVPSIYIARNPDLISTVAKHNDYDRRAQQPCRSTKKRYHEIGKYTKFIIACDKGFVTRRAVSYLRTTLQWLNHYEDLKKYEIDHKKSCGAYVWQYSFTELKDFKLWLSLTDEERKKTAVMAKKSPGSTLVLPPGMTGECISPSLPQLSGEDRDIKEMIAAGSNEPADIMTGTSAGSYSSVRETRGPMSDRTADENAYLYRFLIHDFWSSIFFLKSQHPSFPSTYDKVVGTGWKNKKVVKKTIQKTPEWFIDIQFPVSETLDTEGKARAVLGVKHGPFAAQLGIPNTDVAKTLGIEGYGRKRMEKAIEDEIYPELEYEVDAEAEQEKKIEPKGNKKLVDGETKKSTKKEKK